MSLQSNKSPLNRFVLSGGRLLVSASNTDGFFDVLVDAGRVAGVEPQGTFSNCEEVEFIDISGKLLVPGLIDLHVHLREPGQEWKETILSGSRAAVAGGFTSIVCMPNTIPAIDSAETVRFVLGKAAEAALSKVYTTGCITLKREGKVLAPYAELVDAGCIAFTDDGAPVVNALVMRRALEYAKLFSIPLAVHEEDRDLAGDFSMNESLVSLELGLKGMPTVAEDVMIARDIELARYTRAHVHFCHVSTARAVTLIKRAKEDGINVTAEVTPHYFTLSDKAVMGYNTNAKMSMPLRSEQDVDCVMDGLAKGIIDCIASDHAPHESDSKRVEFDKASFGIIGLQTTLPLTLAKVREGKLSLQRAIEAMTCGPANCMKVVVNNFVVGDPADITVIDLEAEIKFEEKNILSMSKNSPFLGCLMKGLADRVFVDGREVYRRELSQ